MIDKLDVRIPEFTAHGPDLREPMELLKRNNPIPSFRPSKYYQYMCDLREPFNVDAMVHLNFRFGRENHKVEIIDAGEKTLEQMVTIILQVFDVDPWNLEIMRTDLAADVEGAPVAWFKDHAYVNRKRYSSRIAKSFEQEMEFVCAANATAQTIYAGKRPNFYRIYDKFAEFRMQLRKIEAQCRKFNAGLDGLDMSEEDRYFAQQLAPTFQEFCSARGYDFKPGKILTRIERQLGAKIPSEFATLGDLRYVHELCPFTDLRISQETGSDWYDAPGPGISIRDHLAAVGFETVKKQFGSLQTAKHFVYQHSNGNGKRVLDALAESCPQRVQPITLAQIHESYRASTVPQTSQLFGERVYT